LCEWQCCGGHSLASAAKSHFAPRELTLQAHINLDADAELTAPLLLWIAPEKVFGGNVGFGVIIPYGRKAIDADIDALATLTLPLLHRTLQAEQHFDFDQSTTDLGDPALNALIGWQEVNLFKSKKISRAGMRVSQPTLRPPPQGWVS
jgi:hypothetical protein